MGIISILFFWGLTICTTTLITIGEVQKSNEPPRVSSPPVERKVCRGDINKEGVVCTSWDVKIPDYNQKPF
jgi:hypothetical protein